MRALLWTVSLLSLLAAATVHAHMPAGYDLRAVHFEHAPDGLHAYYRLTLPLVVANRLGPKDEAGLYRPAPFTVRRIESAHAFYYVDAAAVRADLRALAKLALDGHRVAIGDSEIPPRLISARVYPKGAVPPFGTLDQARAATTEGEPYPSDAADVDVAYAVVDIHAVYAAAQAIDRFSLGSPLGNRVLGQPTIQTLLIDHRPGGPVMYRRVGLLDEPIAVNPSLAGSAWTFTCSGLAHILSGADHLLFVLLLTLGAGTLSTLLWRISGFTLGHAITVTASFMGYAPSQTWFSPAVETAIAASIALAAISVLAQRGGRKLFVLATLIGVVHGFGFSAALTEMLQRDGPNPWSSLLAFNAGIELGQVAFAAAVWLAMSALTRMSAVLRRNVTVGVAAACLVVSGMWLLQRAQILWTLQA